MSKLFLKLLLVPALEYLAFAGTYGIRLGWRSIHERNSIN